jgi:hypothetical protein
MEVSDVCAGNISGALQGMESLLSVYEGMLTTLAASKLSLSISLELPPEISMSIRDLTIFLKNAIAASLVNLSALEAKKNLLLSAAAGAVNAAAQGINNMLTKVPTEVANRVTSAITSLDTNIVDTITSELQGLISDQELQEIINKINEMLNVSVTIPMSPKISAGLEALAAQMSISSSMIAELRSKLQLGLNCMV